MRKFSAVAVAAAALTLSASQSRALEATVPFTGLVTAACVLTVGTPGLLGVNTGSTELSSLAGGGTPGTISALSTGTAFKVSALAPSAFTLSPDGSTSVLFSTTYSGTGATTIGSTPGTTQTTLGTGVTNLSVNLKAQKTAGVFAGGAYAAEVIVRCE